MWKQEQFGDLRWKKQAMKEVESEWADHQPKFKDTPNMVKVEEY